LPASFRHPAPHELGIPGMMGSMPMTYMVNGGQYIAFTVGTPTQAAEVVSLALDK
jgi:hypothetical protein